MLPKAEMKKSTPARMSDFLRPKRVASTPERAEPMIHPIRADEHVKPCQASV